MKWKTRVRQLVNISVTQNTQTHLGTDDGAFFHGLARQVKFVRWLPIHWPPNDAGDAMYLPCPICDLVRVIGCQGERTTITRLLRQNPTLLLFAASKFYAQNLDAPTSASSLISYSQSNLVVELANAKPLFDDKEFSPKKTRKLEKRLRDHLRIRSNQKLRRSLSRFIHLFADLPKHDRTQQIAHWIGNQIRADQLHVPKIRRASTAAQVIQAWTTTWPDDFEINDLLDVAAQVIQSESEFQRRLTDEKLASMKQLAYGASHEINNPLANIATRAQTLLAEETTPHKRTKLSVIYQQAMRAHEMISDMMLFANPPAIRRQDVSIRLLMSKITREFQPTLDWSQNLKFSVTIGAELDRVNIDPTQIAVAVKQLLNNSVEALQSSNRPSQKIEIRIERSAATELTISVFDNGPKISSSIRQHLFDPFFSGREAGRGLGFGLSKVWTIAKLHGGTIEYDDQVTRGTMFRLRLPISGLQPAVGVDRLMLSNEVENTEEDAA